MTKTNCKRIVFIFLVTPLILFFTQCYTVVGLINEFVYSPPVTLKEVTLLNGNVLHFTWDDIPNCDGYEFYYETDNGSMTLISAQSEVIIPFSESFSFRIRAYSIISKAKIYGQFSPTFYVDTSKVFRTSYSPGKLCFPGVIFLTMQLVLFYVLSNTPEHLIFFDLQNL